MDDIDDFLQKNNINLKLNTTNLENLGLKITQTEILNSIKKLKADSTPGISGMDRNFLLFVCYLRSFFFNENP